MKRLLQRLALAALLLSILGACSNPLAGPAKASEATGLTVGIIIPNYAASGGASRIVSSESAYALLRLDGEEYSEPLPLALDPLPDGAAPGTPRTATLQIGGIPARTYGKISLDILDASQRVLTTGAVFGVKVTPLAYVPVSITCFVPEENFTVLSSGTAPLPCELAQGGMAFFKFYARSGGIYTFTAAAPAASATQGPDLYLFLPNGKPAKDELGDYIAAYHPAAAGGELSLTLDLADEATSYTPGMYVLGVYAAGADLSFTARLAQTGTLAESAATPFVDAGFSALRQGDLDGAIAEFAKAVARDPSSGEAALGYSLVNLLSATTDARMVDLARNRLGFVDYPSRSTEVLSSAWLVATPTLGDFETDDNDAIVYAEYGQVISLPRIVDEASFDGILGPACRDGVIDAGERAVAFYYHYAMNNTGFDPIADALGGAVQERFSAAAAILDAVDDGAVLEVSWDLLFDTPEAAYDLFHLDVSVTPIIRIGKAELGLIAGLFGLVDAFSNYASVYSYDFSSKEGSGYDLLKQIWANYAPSLDDPYLPYSWIFRGVESPFAFLNFLRPREDFDLHLARAKTALAKAGTNIGSALGTVANRLPADGYLFCPDTLATLFPGEDEEGNPLEPNPEELKRQFQCMSLIGQRIAEALAAEPSAASPLLFPIGEVSSAEYLAKLQDPAATPDWQTWGAVRVEALFASPLSFVFELVGTGEPQWYRRFEDPAENYLGIYRLGLTTSVPYQESNPWYEGRRYYLKASEAVTNGIFGSGPWPLDDPSTRFRVELSWWDQTFAGVPEGDPNYGKAGNGKWDPGEYISGMTVLPNYDSKRLTMINGDAVYYAEDGVTPVDPYRYYDIEAVDDLLIRAWLAEAGGEAAAQLAAYVAPENLAALQALVNGKNPDDTYAIPLEKESLGSMPIGRMEDGKLALYVGVPSAAVWNSINNRNVRDSLTGRRSWGSFWYWALLDATGISQKW